MDDRRDPLDIDDDRPRRSELADDVVTIPVSKGQEVIDFGPDFDPDPF